MSNEIKKIETFDVDEKVAELEASTIEVMSHLNNLYSSVHQTHPTIAWAIKPVIDSLKNSGVDLEDEDDYCLDIDRLNGCLDREVNRLNSQMYYLSLPIYPTDIREEVERIRNKLMNIQTLIRKIIAYYDEHGI